MDEKQNHYVPNQIGIWYDGSVKKDELKEQLQNIGFDIGEYKLVQNYFVATFSSEKKMGLEELEELVRKNVSNYENLKFEPVGRKKIQ